MENLDEAAKVLHMLGEKTQAQVMVARQLGANWEQIATSLGVTRQAAWARYHKVCRAEDSYHGPQQLTGALRHLQFLRARTVKLEDKTARLVKAARTRGKSWEEIAVELGVRRQTAWERYGKS